MTIGEKYDIDFNSIDNYNKEINTYFVYDVVHK